MEADLPFVDEHRTTVEAPRDVVWPRLRAYVGRMLAAHEHSLLTRVLGTVPATGFEVSEEVPDECVVLTGRHRFSRYALVLELEPVGDATVLRARTFASFPGPHGRAYRLLVITSRAHVLATRRLLAAMRRACLEQVST